LDHLGGIVGTIDRPPDFDLLIAVQDVALRNGIQAVIIDGPDRRLLTNVNMNGPAFGRLLALHPDIFKISAVPDGTQITLEGRFVVNIANAGINARLDRLRGNATVPDDVNVLYDLPGLWRSE